MPGPKLNNRRVYPDANHQPCHLARLRREGSKERQEAYDKLTLQQKLERLPANGAKKQRARLEALLQKQQEKVAQQTSAPAKQEAVKSSNNQQKKTQKEGK